MSDKKTLNLNEIKYLIANKPLAIVRLEHSPQTKTLICKAISDLKKDVNSKQTFETLLEFLKDRAPKYNLNRNENGAREFLIREIEKALGLHRTGKPQKTGLMSLFKLVTG
ncbi:hypothetical protein SCOR_00690 [Sulfidibacter corallicola]|uniref:Uncharacterized protein n=1 Tax=Sulfidibacter corallicola TaxID=2818388 RepID=A0A8A4THI8_SULCO|nr:hypothetical protein [Sulfidibacter corallicola]QTD48957.1 hypothetical protein J3U87_25515 [Sulfidibacter corallicola]